MDKLFRKWTKVDKSGKKKYNQTDMTEEGKTIIAIATAAGPGAIGIIRISGPDSLKGVKRAFTGFKREVKPNTCLLYTSTKHKNIVNTSLTGFALRLLAPILNELR